MGIQDLTKTIKKYAPLGLRHQAIEDLPGLKYGVDVFSYLYPAKYNQSSKGKGSHIRFFFDLIVKWHSKGKSLIMVFDGNTSLLEIKAETNQKRQEARDRNKETIHISMERIQNKTATEEDYINLEMASRNDINVTDSDVLDLKQLFSMTGICYYQAEGEADCLLGALYQSNIIDGVLSEDSDMLTHGVGCLVRGLIDSSNRNKGMVDLYILKDVLNGLGMNQGQFVDFCILSGCDYCKRLPGIGSVTALKYIKKWGSVKDILDNLELSPNDKDEYLKKYREAYRMFSDHGYIPTPTVKEEQIQDQDQSQEQGEELSKWILENTNYRVDTICEKLAVLAVPVKAKEIIQIKIKPKILRKE